MGNAKPDYVTTQEAAEILGVSKSRVDQFVREGRLPAMPFGVARMILRSDVLNLKKKPRTRGRPKKESESG